MEKLPLGERPEPHTVGRGSAEAKEAARREIVEGFGGSHFAQFNERQLAALKAEEREKTDEEKECIQCANEVTNELLREFGVKEFDIPLDNVHFVSQKFWDEELGKNPDVISMTSDPQHQAIFAEGNYDSKERVRKARTMLHEFIHLKGHLSVEVDSETSKDLYRSGLVTYSSFQKTNRSGLALWFNGLNEAVVTEMESKYADQVVRSNAFLKDEIEWLDSPEAVKLKEEYAQKNEIDPNEIEWISRDGDLVHLESYRKQRRVFNYVIDQIYADGGFESRDGVKQLFFEAHFKNSLLPIGHLVEKTFGKGSFRELGDMDGQEGSSSAGRVLDFLMKRRREITGKKEVNK